MDTQIKDNPTIVTNNGPQVDSAGNAFNFGGPITTDQLKPASSLVVPSSTGNNALSDGVASTGVTTVKSLQDYAKEEQDAYATPESSQYQTALSDFSSLMGMDTGKTQALAQAKIDSGAVDLSKQLTDLNGQITVGNASYAQLQAQEQADLAKAEGSSRSAFDYAGTTGAIQRQKLAERATKAAEIGMLAARAQAVSGNLSTALTIAQNSVDAKYGPIEDALKVKSSQLDALKNAVDRKDIILTKAEAAQMKDRDRKYTEDREKLAEEKAKAKENTGLALTAGINTKFVNKNGEFFNTTTGETFDDPKAFFKAAGVTSFDQAYKIGLITDLSNSQIQDIGFAQQAQAKYNDVRIPPNSTPEQVRELIKSSRIYRKETYIAPPAGTGNGPNGLKVSPALAAAINAGTIDPNKLNSRTLSIYESIAQAGVDAVGSHAGAAGETKAVQDLVAYKSVATRTLGVLDKNLPLVADLADKVNQTGVPGLDQYLQGVKAYTGNDQNVIRYVNSLKTLRSEYAQMLAKGGSATESDKAEAAQAIPAGLSGEAYNALGDQLKLEANNILQASNDAISAAKDKSSSNDSVSNVIPQGTDGEAYGYPGYVSDGTQWVQK